MQLQVTNYHVVAKLATDPSGQQRSRVSMVPKPLHAFSTFDMLSPQRCKATLRSCRSKPGAVARPIQVFIDSETHLRLDRPLLSTIRNRINVDVVVGIRSVQLCDLDGTGFSQCCGVVCR
jgi:hypothetical protein